MEDVALATELSTGALYLYFKNKDALFCAVVLEGVRVLNGLFRKAVSDGGNGRAKLQAVGAAYMEFYRTYPGQFRAFMELQSYSFPEDDESMIQLNELVGENVRGIVCRCISEGMADGSLRGDIDPLQTTLFLIISMQNVVCLAPGPKEAFKRNNLSQEAFARYSLDMMIRLLSFDRQATPKGERPYHEDFDHI